MPSPSGRNGNGKNGNGRDPSTGQFVKGYEGGPGRPGNKFAQQFRQDLLKSATPERRQELIERLWKMAMGEDAPCTEDDKTWAAQRWAMQQILDRILGKPKETVAIQTETARGDPFGVLKDAEVVSAVDRSLTRVSTCPPLAKPGGTGS